MDNLNFQNRVVVVTGAGNGLGRSHALEFSRRGAKVVVNDLGGSGHGQGENRSVAQQVVDEIHSSGGQAVANTDSVEQGERIVETAMEAFGRIDVVVNNAGILRDVAFHKMDDADWALIQKVHLDGSYRVTKAAWPHMRRQNYGRILMTSSAAGIYGNFGQANYAAAKLGLHGLAQSLAIEGRAKGIHVNTIAPIAASRLTETAMPAEILACLKPALVTPLAILLCSEDCKATGELFEVGGGWVSRLRWQQSRGAMFEPGSGYSAEDLAARWNEVQDFTDAYHPTDLANTLQVIGDNVGITIALAPQ